MYNIDRILFVEGCIFLQCSSTNDGGGIYYICDTINSKITIKKTCSEDCNCNSNGQFAVLIVKSNINNLLLQSLNSYSKCGNKFVGNCPTFNKNGDQIIESINSSFNKCNYHSGHYIENPSRFNGIFCSFIDNKVGNGIVFHF